MEAFVSAQKENSPEPSSEGKGAKPKKEKKASHGPRKGSRRELPLELVKGVVNPYRVATASHKAFTIAEANAGLTFNELVKKGARANTLAEMIRKGNLKPTKG